LPLQTWLWWRPRSTKAPSPLRCRWSRLWPWRCALCLRPYVVGLFRHQASLQGCARFIMGAFAVLWKYGMCMCMCMCVFACTCVCASCACMCARACARCAWYRAIAGARGHANGRHAGVFRHRHPRGLRHRGRASGEASGTAVYAASLESEAVCMLCR
jgi:hypothetical protein